MNKNYILIISLILLFGNPSQAQWQKTSGPLGFSSKKLWNYHNALYSTCNTKGVYKSYNNGASWIASSAGIIGKMVECFASDSSYLYIGLQDGGVMRSSDDGLTWQPTGFIGALNGFVACLLTANNFLY